MICPTCDRETAAVSELGEMSGARMRKRCAHPDCKAALPEERPASQAVAAPALARVEQALDRPPAHPGNGAPPSLAQTLALFEARLTYVRERIVELRAFEAEERQLGLILAAAGKPAKEVKPS